MLMIFFFRQFMPVKTPISKLSRLGEGNKIGGIKSSIYFPSTLASMCPTILLLLLLLLLILFQLTETEWGFEMFYPFSFRS